MFGVSDFREYRQKLGFINQTHFKEFLSAKDIKAQIDYAYLELLNERLCEIFRVINAIYYRPINVESFLQMALFATFSIIKNNGILNKLNNQGRRKEEVYFSWIRGFLICEYFKGAICEIFDISLNEIQNIGDDDFRNLETFKRTPSADLETNKAFLEIQSGFVGINDIKEHKVKEAKKRVCENGKRTIVLHFDIFNGQVAFVDISNIADDDLNWITRQQMEGQSVFNIEQNYFQWFLWQNAPKFSELEALWNRN